MADLRDAVNEFRDGQERFRPVITGWMIDEESIGSAKVSDEPGYVYVLADRGEGVVSGDVIKARARIRPVPGWAVRVSTTRDRPWEYTVLDVDLEAMGGGAPTAGGGIDGEPILEHHHEMHEWSNPSGSDDVVYPRFIQLYDFGNWPGLGLCMNNMGGILNPSGTIAEMDFTGYCLDGLAPPSGERYVLVCISPTGTIELVPGIWDTFVGLDDIPVAPSTDHWEVAAVKVSFGQTQITHTPTSPGVVDLRFARLGWPGRASPQYVLRSQWLQNGFIDATDVSLAWDDATRTLTVAPVGDSFDYLHDGILYTKTVAETITITDTEGLWVIYYDALTLTSNHTPSEAEIDAVIENQTIVAYIEWDATNNDGRLMYELHDYRMSPVTCRWLHDNIGAVYRSGMALSDFVIDDTGADDEDAQFSVAAGEFYDEDLEFDLAAVGKLVGLEIWYLIGADWRWATNAGFSILTTGSGRMAWNDGGAQTEVGTGKFALCHVFATNITADDGTSPKYIAIQGQNEYLTKAAARAGADTEINTLVYAAFPLQEVVPIATVIFQSSNGYGNAVKSRTVTTASGDNYVDWRGSNIKASGGSIADHGALAGLADDDHQQYLLLAGRSGGQIGYGGTASGDDLTLYSTSHATKGTINLGDTLYVDEVNNRAGFGIAAPDALIQIVDSAASTLVEIDAYSTDDSHQSVINFRKSGSATIGTTIATADNEDVGQIIWTGVNASNAWANTALLLGEQDGAAGATFVPGRLLFHTSSTAATNVERVRIDSAGNVGIGMTPTNRLSIKGDNALLLQALNGTDRMKVEYANGTSAVLKLYFADGTLRTQISAASGQQSFFNSGSNVIIGATAAGATAARVLALTNAATAPTASANLVHLYGEDVSASAVLAIYQETAPVAIGTFTPSHKWLLRLNGVSYHIQLDAV